MGNGRTQYDQKIEVLVVKLGKKGRLPVVIGKATEKKHMSGSTLYTEHHDI
jgi:hypothetical protein